MKQLYIWAARDVDSKEIVTFRCSFTRSSIDAELSLKDVLQYRENETIILVDHRPLVCRGFEEPWIEV